jgi:hypothetical protein
MNCDCGFSGLIHISLAKNLVTHPLYLGYLSGIVIDGYNAMTGQGSGFTRSEWASPRSSNFLLDRRHRA